MHESISKADVVRLKGLEALKKENDGWRNKIEEAIAGVVGEERSSLGHFDSVGDWWWEEKPIETLLNYNDIEVTDE